MCGGLVVGIIWHHHAADGHSMSAFLATWASAVRDGDGFAAPSPLLDRAASVVPRSVPAPAFDHRSTEFKLREEGKPYRVVPMENIKNLKLHFSAEFLTELKAHVGARCSTFQCVLAHVWKKITAARGLDPEEFTRVRVAVNCRSRAEYLSVPTDFFGNMVLWAFPRLQVQDLLSLSYASVVGVIRDAVARVHGAYIRSFVDFGTVADAHGEELVATAAPPGTVFCPDLEVDSWLGFKFHEIDLGGGTPSAFLEPDLPVEGLMIFVPSSPTAKGGVNVFVAVGEDHVAAFQQICYSFV